MSDIGVCSNSVMSEESVPVYLGEVGRAGVCCHCTGSAGRVLQA